MSAGLFVLTLVLAQFGQPNTGELRVTVTDQSGLPLEARIELTSDANQVQDALQTTEAGTALAKRLTFGLYRIAVTSEGFAPFAGVVEIRSAVPTEYPIVLSLAPLQSQLIVAAEDTLLDPHQTATVHHVGAEALQRRLTALPGRSLPDLVNTQPGWLLEANGILHPRGSEYQTQYVIDGLPLTDNRSPAFAPEIDVDDVHAMNIMTGGYPAEYGRKLGGVIELVTGGEARRGLHGTITGSLGSLGTESGDALGAYVWPRTTISVAGGAAGTDRYLDPPVEENFTNRGTTSHVAVRLEHDVTDADRFGIIVREGNSEFLVPNERVQQDAGQRQDRHAKEAVGQMSYQHVFSKPLVADVRGMWRDLSAELGSNAASVPIIATQSRGIRDAYLKATVSAHVGVHELKAGADVSAGRLRESFSYQISNPERFDPGTSSTFAFDDRAHDREQAVFVQDRLRLGSWTVSAGVRWDHYQVVVEESALSPRLGIAWALPDKGLVVRGSYDRAFQTPAVENLLLASSPNVAALADNVVRLPVRASHGNFYEGGISKTLRGVVRFDASYFERHMTNFADDDLLLNTGISFPIAFQQAEIRGTELTLAVPHWNRLTGSISYSNQHGVGRLPVTGGLFLGDEAASVLNAVGEFPISQDQRHTVRGRASYRIRESTWLAVAAAFGSGLPFEFAGDYGQAVAQYGQRIVDRVDFGTGRVRPFFSLDASAGLTLTKTSTRRLSLQVDVRNLTDRLNVVDFAGLFSGTALAPPRSGAIRVRAEF